MNPNDLMQFCIFCCFACHLEGWKVTVAICDAGGNLIALQRMALWQKLQNLSLVFL